MSIVWLLILLIYGFVNGFSEIRWLDWMLLWPLFGQDVYDVRRKNRS